MTERFRDIAQLWNWLPAFRAVAETEHLPSASEMMNITAPALSRTVKQLEEALGYELFHRKGRRLELNDEGKNLLLAVRDGMRLVSDAIELNEDKRFSGPFRWTSNWALSGVTLSALRAMVAEHPELRPRMYSTHNDILGELRRGELDVAIVGGKIEAEGLTATLLGETPQSVYCGREHDLFGVSPVDWDDLEGHKFCAPLPTESGAYEDGWPPDRDRQIVMEFSQMAVGFRACRDSDLLAVLPDEVAYDEDGLWRLIAIEGNHHAFAIHRSTLNIEGPIENLMARIQSLLIERSS